MKYMLLVYGSEDDFSKDEANERMPASMQVGKDLDTLAKRIAFSRLDSVHNATCVRVRNGECHVTAGPYAETMVQLGGYGIVDAGDLDEAIGIASGLPQATRGTVEIRPLLPLPDSLSLPEGGGLAGASDVSAKQNDYLLLMYAEDGAWPPEEHAVALAESVEVCHQLHGRGQFISAAPLQPPTTATRVRIRNGSRVVVDGPFAETKEQLGGYFLIRVANMEEAIAIAARIPGSRRGTAEIRCLIPSPEPSRVGHGAAGSDVD